MDEDGEEISPEGREDLSIDGKMGMHPWRMKMEMKRLMRSLRRSDYSHEIRSYLLLVRYKLRYDPDADIKLDTFDGRRFPGGLPGTTRPPGEEPRESTCNASIGPPCPRGGSSPGDGARGRAFPPGGCWGGGQPPRRVAEASCLLHYRDQAVNAGDDGPATGKSIA